MSRRQTIADFASTALADLQIVAEAVTTAAGEVAVAALQDALFALAEAADSEEGDAEWPPDDVLVENTGPFGDDEIPF